MPFLNLETGSVVPNYKFNSPLNVEATSTHISFVSKLLDAVKESSFNKVLPFQNFQTTNQELHGKQIALGRTPKVGWCLEGKFLSLFSEKNVQIYVTALS